MPTIRRYKPHSPGDARKRVKKTLTQIKKEIKKKETNRVLQQHLGLLGKGKRK